jgi:ArsR family transcriptional regulator, arsenate/arsenite/antimonite-responsive transcriptional repressor
MLDNVDMSRHIDEKTAIEALAALAQPTRLDVFRRLIKSYPDEIAAGEIARQCKMPHNSMSTHLAILTRAGLVSVRKEGRMMHYGANLPGFQRLMSFLLQDCCQGRAEICAPLVAQLTCCLPAKERKKVHA